MYACYKGKAEVARVLYEAHPFQLTWINDAGENALHLGAEGGCPEVIILLLDIGVPVMMNNKHQTFFDVVINKRLVNCAMTAIKHKRWQECLDVHYPHKDHPMISLIQFMPEVAKTVLDRSHTKADLQHEDLLYWETYDFKYIRLDRQDSSHNVLQQSGQSDELSQYEDGASAVKYKETRRKSSFPRFMKKTFDEEPVSNNLEVLQNMVRHNRVPLLTHPVTESYLKVKWERYGRWVQLAKTSLISLQIIFLLVFTFSAPTPTEIRSIEAMNSTVNCTDGINCTGTVEFSTTATAACFLAMIFALVQFFDWLVAVIRLGVAESLNITRNSFVLIDGLSILMTLIFTIPWTSTNSVVWQAGAIAFFFAWFSLFLTI